MSNVLARKSVVQNGLHLHNFALFILNNMIGIPVTIKQSSTDSSPPHNITFFAASFKSSHNAIVINPWAITQNGSKTIEQLFMVHGTEKKPLTLIITL